MLWGPFLTLSSELSVRADDCSSYVRSSRRHFLFHLCPISSLPSLSLPVRSILLSEGCDTHTHWAFSPLYNEHTLWSSDLLNATCSLCWLTLASLHLYLIWTETSNRHSNVRMLYSANNFNNFHVVACFYYSDSHILITWNDEHDVEERRSYFLLYSDYQ